MPATKARDTAAPPHALVSPSQTTAATADLVFVALRRLHGLSDADAALLHRAAAGLRFIRSTETYSPTDQAVFRIALTGLDERDAHVVETAACLAADLGPNVGSRSRFRIGDSDKRRALWFAAMLRLADALCQQRRSCPEGVFATWTDELLYIEFDGDHLSETEIERARTRVAAVEALTGRRAVLARSSSRRGVA